MTASTPEPPYVAVIFTSRLADAATGYDEAAERMERLAGRQPGFLGVESARGADGLGITVSYWTDEAAVRAWRDEPDHALARRRGREAWYDRFTVRVAHVGRAETWARHRGPDDQSEPAPVP